MSACRLLLVLLLVLLTALPAHARRLALVIGNDDYKQFAKLEKAGNDAEAVAKELEAAGFEVSLRRDLGYRRMVVAFEEFYDKVKPGDELVVFYAGHGVQTERGAYLLPADIEGDTASQIEKMSYPVNGLLEELDRMKPRVALVVVDACRDNPLRIRGRAIGAARGLSGPDVSKGQMVIFSAGRNQKALDGLGNADTHPNGVFTRELLARMRTKGQTMEQLAIGVRDAVEQLAQKVKHEQRPLIVNDMAGSFYLYPPAEGTAVAAAPAAAPGLAMDAASREDRFWEDTKAADNAEAYEAYLATYPSGRYRGLARANISRLAKPPVQLAQNTRGADTPPAAGSAAPAAADAAAPGAAALPTPVPGASPTPAPTLLPASAPVPAPAPAPTLPAATPATVPPALVAPAAPSVQPAAPVRSRASYALPNGDRYEGDVLGARRSGQGVYHFANGDRYEGLFADDRFAGKGVMRFANGDRYEGEFDGITKQGQGAMVFANGDRFEGQFEANQYHGRGSFTFAATGERYSGDYQRGLKHGQGEQLFANKDRYVGAFVADKPHGAGKMTHANGDVFEGEFVQGIKQGAGRYTFANGDRYEGNFADGLFSGKGRLYMAGGDRYEGDFRNNVKQGQGVHYFASKDRYEGGFVNGVQHGAGVHYFANGDRYVGEFAGGVRHGKGVHHFAGGSTREMEYANGAEKAP